MSARLERLHAYHDGELGALRRWQVRRWLARDPAARRELEALQGVRAAVRQAQAEVRARAEAGLSGEAGQAGEAGRAELWSSLERRLRSIDAERRAESPSSRSWRGLGRRGPGRTLGPALAGALVVAVVAGLALFRDAPAAHEGGVVRWLDTRGQAVMVLDEGDATIIWLLQPGIDADVDQAGRRGGRVGLG